MRKILFLLIHLFAYFLSYSQDEKLNPSSIVLRDTVFNFVFDSISHNFGNIVPVNENNKTVKYFKYIGKEPIMISRAWTGDPHFICDYPKEVLIPNKIYSFTVCFWHKNNQGYLSKRMGFDLTDGNTISFKFTGFYVPINENELSSHRILDDIKQLKEDGHDFFEESDEEIDLNPKEISCFKLNNVRLALFNTNRDFSSFSPVPLKENRVNLLLLYLKNGTDWKLDTVFTTYPDFYPIHDTSGYFMAEAQRCTEGRCQWYKVIQKITKKNQLKTVFEYENFNRIMYLEDVLLPENREFVTREIGKEVQDETEILECIWNKQKLTKIRIKQTKGVLTGIENDSLIIKFDTTSRIITLQN